MRFFALALLAITPLLGTIPQPFLKSTHHTSLNTFKRLSLFQQLLQRSQWNELGIQVRLAVKSGEISLNDLESLATMYPGTAFSNALFGTKRLLSLEGKTGLSLEIAFPIALFAETSLADEITKGHFFWSEHRFGRELQFDPSTKRFFIHLGTHGIPAIGVGRKKVVTKTILYSRTRPVIMARGLTICDISDEMHAMRVLKNRPGLLNAEALLTHTDPHSHKRLMAIVTKIFTPGCLHNALHTTHFTLKEKLKIASDITKGLSSMHERGYVHRDLGARNHFINISGTVPDQRTITCVIADMGRALPVRKAAGQPAQGNWAYLPPEGFFYKKMKATDYYASDLFTVGCVLWTVYFEKMPAWTKARSYGDRSKPVKERYKQHILLIRSARKPIQKKLHHKSRKNASLSLKERFEQIVLQMTDPDPHKRGTAQQHAAQFAALYAQT
jgi:hypothetical protein